MAGSFGDLKALSLAVKWLHLFRYELRHVTECDFDGVTIQHQGDRLQAFVHTPAGNDGRIIRKAVEACISYNSSVEEILNVEGSKSGHDCAYAKRASLVETTQKKSFEELRTFVPKTSHHLNTMPGAPS